MIKLQLIVETAAPLESAARGYSSLLPDRRQRRRVRRYPLDQFILSENAKMVKFLISSGKIQILAAYVGSIPFLEIPIVALNCQKVLLSTVKRHHLRSSLQICPSLPSNFTSFLNSALSNSLPAPIPSIVTWAQNCSRQDRIKLGEKRLTLPIKHKFPTSQRIISQELFV